MAIKCVVWDLDNTLWKGVLSEGDDLVTVDDAIAAIKALDERGILNSIASRNDAELALEKIESLGLHQYFLYPQIGWGTKSEALKKIAKKLNIGVDALALVDDDAFEREEVTTACPGTHAYVFQGADSLLRELGVLDMRPTPEARDRRKLYLSEMVRERAEAEFPGPKTDFLKSLSMKMRIWHAGPDDLERVEELVQRTNQLNSTGRIYTYSELKRVASSTDHVLLLASLADRFGDYGTIGVAVCEKSDLHWKLVLLLMSCRIMSRGVSQVLMNFIVHLARKQNAELVAIFRDTGRNQPMFIAYKMAGFTEHDPDGEERQFLAPLGGLALPDYVEISYENSES